MRDYLSSAAIEAAVRRAFHQDVQSLKPGNVHRYAAGHDMSVADFATSARVSVPWLLRSDLSVGRRLYYAVAATHEAVNCNTNLGLLLLFLPLIRAVEQRQAGKDLRTRVNTVLLGLDDTTDTEWLYDAIRLASPGGLGSREQHDVAATPSITIREAMCAAQHYDRIAYQYASGYADIFGKALNCLRACQTKWQSVDWALVACYLCILSEFTDSHIVRKYGKVVAHEVREQGEAVLSQFIKYKNPEEATPLLLDFDTQLKQKNINPGTSADLAAACSLAIDLDTTLVG